MPAARGTNSAASAQIAQLKSRHFEIAKQLEVERIAGAYQRISSSVHTAPGNDGMVSTCILSLQHERQNECMQG